MSGDLSLFGDDQPDQPTPVVRDVLPIAAWQIELLRKALDARGLTSMSERQAVIESEVGHHVDSLGALTHDEALRVLSRIGQSGTSRPRSTSSWMSGMRTPGSIGYEPRVQPADPRVSCDDPRVGYAWNRLERLGHVDLVTA